MGAPNSLATYDRTTVFRIHEVNVLPVVFQTEPYMRALIGYWRDFYDAPDDSAELIAFRHRRNARALNPGKRIVAVLAEDVLRTRFCDPAVHAAQLLHLLSIMLLPYVSVGIIPSDRLRRGIASIGFWIFDDGLVMLETPSAQLRVTQPAEICTYVRLFEDFQRQAEHGAAAWALVHRAMMALGDH
ncbi:hypothetical protein GCM10010123_35470 [Pilimelia anulata]|uniref:DUF5753 domain-containing protein n=2 Tax=Pilimelia anulata TaxID=53371 RepID=A0A8J3B8P7_9ACTN|nr:hypothetical protein GCM10010123_35470 [Pilimelia anulata]